MIRTGVGVTPPAALSPSYPKRGLRGITIPKVFFPLHFPFYFSIINYGSQSKKKVCHSLLSGIFLCLYCGWFLAIMVKGGKNEGLIKLFRHIFYAVDRR